MRCWGKFALHLIVCAVLFAASAAFAENVIPRKIIALYDGDAEKRIAFTRMHVLAEMPLNHLGFILEYTDANKELPDLSKRKDVAGVISWFPPGAGLDNPIAYLEWANGVIALGKKFVIIENPGFNLNKSGKQTPINLVNNFLRNLGLKDEGRWINYPYNLKLFYKDPSLMEYERSLTGYLAPFEAITAKSATSHFTVQSEDFPDKFISLISTSENGGYIAENYAAYIEDTEHEGEFYQWYIDPFKFFALVFNTDELPKPDTTTIAGRRIYYSQIDGDGWNSLTQIEKYKSKPTLTPEVILENIVKPYPHMPVTIAPIAADIDVDWVGTKESIRLAKELFALPQVEIGTHTYSHPLYWQFFEDNNPEKERPYLDLYWSGNWAEKKNTPFLYSVLSHSDTKNKHKDNESDELHGYSIPRAYANEKFNLEKEIAGSISKINLLAPPGKKVEILQWSGNTSPFQKALELTRKSGIKNINGGDSRFDPEYPSIAWIAPLSRRVGPELQIYASTSNENTYTDLWTERFHAFRYLQATLKNTESPIRIKPIDIYYHMYSGEKQASLNALISNIKYAEAQNIAPVSTSYFCSIAESFFTTDIIKLGENKWKITKRGDMQTIRFDKATEKAVDFASSDGIIGQRHFQGSLYVYLDESTANPVITLKNNDAIYMEPAATTPYLLESRWRIWDAKNSDEKFSFKAKGFGKGEMKWRVPFNGSYTIEAKGKKISATSKNHILKFELNDNAAELVRVTVTRN